MANSLSKRIENMQFSPIRKLRPLELDAIFRGVEVLHLNIGQPDIPTPSSFWEKAAASSDITSGEKVLAYGPSDGLPEFKQVLSDYYHRQHITLLPEHIMVTTAGSEAILFTLMAICDPGDEIIVPEPFYTNYNGFAAMAGVTIKPISTSIESGFALPATEDFAQLITEKTRAVLICNPNNPTGAVYPVDAIDALINLCYENALFLIADEVYRDFTYESEPVSILQRPGVEDVGIVIDSLSKRYSACGSRIGAICSYHKEFLSQVLKCAQSRLCPPTLEQTAAVSLVATGDSAVLEMKEEYRRRIAVIDEVIGSEEDILYSHPQGAFYSVLKLPVDNAETFAAFMLKDFQSEGTTVLVAPAAGFYQSPGKGIDEIRIAAVLKPKIMRQALTILIKGLREYQRLQTH